MIALAINESGCFNKFNPASAGLFLWAVRRCPKCGDYSVCHGRSLVLRIVQ